VKTNPAITTPLPYRERYRRRGGKPPHLPPLPLAFGDYRRPGPASYPAGLSP
jgi:hypothetical protein